MSNISEATPQDWEDFWYSPEKFGTWYSTDLEKVWKEMDQIEPLTPFTCLLYTSPSPRDYAASRMPSSA